MKVFAVTAQHFTVNYGADFEPSTSSSASTVGVFSTMEKAEAMKAKVKERWRHMTDVEIEEIEVDVEPEHY